MASARIVLAAAISLSAYAALPQAGFAQDVSQNDSDSRHVFLGEVNANAVFVRSRASEDAYPTMKLGKGAKVTVIGIKGSWLKIEPPDGSFAYVPKSFINMRNDGTVGRANRETIARAGSDLNELAAQPLATVHEGEDVQILGQHNEYFKIKPPKDSYLWINKQFVDPVKTVTQEVAKTPSAEPPHTAEVSPAGPVMSNPGATTRPAGVAELNETPPAGVPATSQPATSDSVAEFGKLEEQFTAAAAKPIAEQPLPQLLAGYQKVLAAGDLPGSMQNIAQIRVATLKVRNDAREKFLALQDNEKKQAEKQKALAAEQQEIEERIKQNNLQIYAAVGTLRPSSLQMGQGMLYRLTDPATGRTVAYVRTSDAKYAQFLGEFIGVRGTIASDPQLKAVIDNPTDAQAVDPSKVNVSVAAQIVPPSFSRFAPSASAAPTTRPAGNSGQASTSSEPQ